MCLVGKIYNVETTVKVSQTVTVKADDCARYILGNDTSSIPLSEYTEEEISNTACGMARQRIDTCIRQDSMNNVMEVTEFGTQEFV